jgi:hypothetical protein
MTSFVAYVWLRGKTFLAMMITSCSFIAPGTLNAQPDQPIVLDCTLDASPTTGRATVTLDLANKTAIFKKTSSNQPRLGAVVWNGAVIRITDEEIAWITSWTIIGGHDTVTNTLTLNRYTLRISNIQVLSSTGQIIGGSQWTCQRLPRRLL